MTRKETCREVAPLIDDLVDGALDGARERAVRGHLRACSACARHYDETSRLVEAANELGSVDPPVEMWQRLSARLDEEEIAFSDKPRVWWWWHAWRARLVFGAVALAGAASAVGFFVMRHAPVAQVAQKPHDPATMYEAGLKEVARAGGEYARAVDELRDIVKLERVRWRPDVAEEFDRNLAIIDAAVERQRQVAAEVPGDLAAQDALADSYRKEIAFLQEAVVREETR